MSSCRVGTSTSTRIRTATIRTIIPSVLLTLQRGQFEEPIGEAPALRERLLRTYAEATE